MSKFLDNKAEEEDEQGQRVDSEDSENDDDIPDAYDKNDGFLVDEPSEDEEAQSAYNSRSRKRERKKGESGEERPKKKQRKRLRKNKEKSEELTNELSELLQDQQQLASKKNRGAAGSGATGDEELAFDQEEGEEEETQSKKKRRDVYDDGFIVGKKRSGGYMEDEHNEDLFGDNEDDMDYDDEVSSAASKKRQTVELQKLYGFEELKELYMTEEDEEIRKEDVPERILLRNKVRAVSEEDMKKEAEWIFELAFKTRIEEEATKKPAAPAPAASDNSGWDFEEEEPQPPAATTTAPTLSVETLRANCIAAIEKILSFLHKAHFDIPFISHYRKEQFVPTLDNDEDLWTIFELDEKWAALQSKIAQVKELYSKSVIDHQYQQLLLGATSMEDVNDLLTHYHAQQAKLTTAPEPTTKRPSRKDLYAVAKRNSLQGFAPTFGLSSSQYAENVSSTFATHRVVDHTQDPDVAALEYRTKELRTTEQVLKATRHMIALDIANEPVIRQKVRLVYELFATVTTKLTPKGESSSIDALKGLLLNKAVLSTFKADPENCIRFVSILKANRDGLLEIHVDVDEDQVDSALDYKHLFLSDKTSSLAQAWNKQREMIMTQVKLILKPSMAMYARSFYSKEANKVILKAAEKKLESMLMVGPLGHKKKKINSDDDDKRDERSAHLIPHKVKILACTPPVGTEPTAFAMLDVDGNIEDQMLWKVSPYQDVTGGVKIEKKERNEKFKYPPQHATQTQDLLNFVRTHRPQAIAISTTTTNAVQLRDIIEETLGLTIPIYYVQDNVARIFETSEKAQKEFADTPVPVRRAVSIGRRLRDPMIEIANLYNEKNDILCLKLHPLQDMLDKDELLRHLEKVFVRVVNKVGVDINKIVMHTHMQNQLRFVGGLGPRKAQYLIKSILAVTGQYINKRKALHESVLGSSVLLNCAGFLKIIPPEKENVDDSDVLENTRIHPESYELAVKMSVDALEDEDNKEDINSSVELVMKEPEKLEDLDLDAYADELEKRKLGKKHITLKDIRNELENPFGDPRDNFREMGDVDLFYAVTGENEFTFHNNMVVTVYVYKKLASGAECKLENGIHGRIPKEDLDNIQEGSYAEAKIQQIDFTHFDVTLSANRSEIEKHKEQEPAKPIPKKKAKPRIQRNINHSCYKNMIYPEAITYLSDKEPGELVIRPSSKGENHLTITFKFFGDTYINLDVKEEKKVDRFSLGKELYVNGKKYDDLDEVCFRCVQNVIEHAKALTQNPKFTDKRPEEIEQVLLKEKQTNPNGIPYRIGLNKDYPGRFFIHYLPGKKVRREAVTVTPDGYSFFKRIFSNPTKLINAFKRSYKEGSNKSSSSSSSSSYHQSHSHSHGSSSSSSYLQEQPRRHSPPRVVAQPQAAASNEDGWDI